MIGSSDGEPRYDIFHGEHLAGSVPVRGKDIQNLMLKDELSAVLHAHLLCQTLIIDFVKLYEPVKVGSSFWRTLRQAKNLGLDMALFATLRELNLQRHKFAHEYAYKVSDRDVEKFATLVSLCQPHQIMSDGEKLDYRMFDTSLEGRSVINGVTTPFKVNYHYFSAERKDRLCLSLTHFISAKLISRIIMEKSSLSNFGIGVSAMFNSHHKVT